MTRLRRLLEGDIVAIAVIAGGAAVRLHYALSTYLNPDEAMHYATTAAPTWGEMYDRSRGQAHPPLLPILQRALMWIDDSEWMLRLPSVLLGVASIWLLYRWLDRARGRSAALAALVFATCSPAMISAATEFRHSALIVFFTCAALVAHERLFESHANPRWRTWLTLSTLSLAGALLSHYSAAFVVTTFGLYSLLRLRQTRAPRNLWLTWSGAQLGLLLLAAWSFFVHGSRYAVQVSVGGPGVAYLQYAYLGNQDPSVQDFVVRNWTALWSFLSGDRITGLIALGLFALGALGCAVRRTPVRRLDLTVLLLTPFLLATVVGLLRLYPFGGIRHVTYLAAFAAGGFGIGTAWLLRDRERWLAALALVLTPLWLAHVEPANSIRKMDRHFLEAAINFVRNEVPPEQPVFVDFQTLRILDHWFRRSGPAEWSQPSPKVREVRIAGRRYLQANGIWAFRAGDLLPQLVPAALALGYRRGQPLWVLSVDWDNPTPFTEATPPQFITRQLVFGTIRVVQLRIPPAPPPGTGS